MKLIENALAQGAPQLDLGSAIPSITWDTLFNRFLLYFLAVAAAAAFLGIIYSGYMMIVSGGDASQMAKAKTNLTWSIIGVFVILLSYFIVRFVFKFAGELG